MWWAILWPFFLALWIFLFRVFASFYLGRQGADPDAGTDRGRWWSRPVQRGLRWVFYLSVGYTGLILVVSLPTWLHWGHLHLCGVPVRAKVLRWSQEYDSERLHGSHFTRVTYQFEAEVDGQRRRFQREGELPGVYVMASGYINVLHDPANPSDSRMTRESGEARNILLSAASFLVLGVASFRLSREPRHAGSTPSAPDIVTSVDGVGGVQCKE